ncbi:hypothetical protein TCDM_03463 [Trypanosoma cruzi Dm28c]|uniref:Uncharacterized protein n=2 Tax=Trypanosoma cruzi TaxID=5693 RepID=V5BNM3_TRYCR|nr:hypothetical protein TCDM_03463 [Trypanosoma cruzi Dm28c]
MSIPSMCLIIRTSFVFVSQSGSAAHKPGQHKKFFFLFLCACVPQSIILRVCRVGVFREELRRMAVQGAAEMFKAFFQSKDENMKSFLCSFVKLSAAERALLAFGEQKGDKPGGTAMESHADAEIFTAMVRDFRTDAQNGNDDNTAIASIKKDGASSGGAGKDCEGLMQARQHTASLHLDGTELEEEVLDESKALKTSAMTTFLNYGLADVVTTFDNFIGGETEAEIALTKKPSITEKVMDQRSVEETGPGRTTPAEGSKEDGNIVVDEGTTSAVDGVQSDRDALREGGRDDNNDYDDDDDDVSFSDIELPGLVVGATLEEPPLKAQRCGVFLSATDLELLRNDDDDEVQLFVIDPCFDYDADPIGRAARKHPPYLRL